MKQRWMVIAVVVALVGCRGGEKATITGSYGSGVISGEVLMAAGGSPQGVEVSLRGTGMTTTLGAEGRFVFATVPERAELGFRRADGIDASLRLDQASGHVVIELAGTTAKKSSSRQRAVRGGGTKVYQFEGLIRSADAQQIVVFTSKKEEVTIALNAQTVIRKGNVLLTVADLLVDTRVHVKAQQGEEVFTALEVKVQREDEGEEEEESPALQQYEGLIVSATATELVLLDSHRTEVTFVIDGATVIRKGNTRLLATDLQPGWRVHVKASTAAGIHTATRITVQKT